MFKQPPSHAAGFQGIVKQCHLVNVIVKYHVLTFEYSFYNKIDFYASTFSGIVNYSYAIYSVDA